MGWGYRYRESTKPSLEQENARTIAMDAFLEGQMSLGKRILSEASTKLSKPQGKKIARVIAGQGRHADAAEVLLMSGYSESSAKEELAPPPVAKVGDILYSSWGWEQTNIDFYEVIAVSGASCTLVKIGKRHVGAVGRGQDTVMPDPGRRVGSPMSKKRVQKSGGKGYEVKVDDRHAWLWDGKPKSETSSGYGH